MTRRTDFVLLLWPRLQGSRVETLRHKTREAQTIETHGVTRRRWKQWGNWVRRTGAAWGGGSDLKGEEDEQHAKLKQEVTRHQDKTQRNPVCIVALPPPGGTAWVPLTLLWQVASLLTLCVNVCVVVDTINPESMNRWISAYLSCFVSTNPFPLANTSTKETILMHDTIPQMSACHRVWVSRVYFTFTH